MEPKTENQNTQDLQINRKSTRVVVVDKILSSDGLSLSLSCHTPVSRVVFRVTNQQTGDED